MIDLRDSISIRGVDGASWALGGPGRTAKDAWITGGLAALFQAAPRTPTRTSRAYEIGSTPRMVKIEERLLDFRVRLEGRTRRDLEQLLAAWNRSWSMYADTQLFTRSLECGTRSIKVRLDRDITIATEHFSMQSTKVDLEMVVVACWPYLTSGTDELTSDFPAGRSEHRFEIHNPTDVPLWMEWGGTPITSAKLPDGLSGRMVPIQAQTNVWKARTRGGLEKLSSADGTNQLKGLRGLSFLYEIPPNTPPTILPAEVTAAVPGKLRAIMPRYHEMPWG
ncbi:hypothetical protein ABH922_002800 [Rhodococcus sp. 27YEA15]|uniref:hypothetical protein n=1 Tax=Rhodococcus sp. 27YEA15 TaxID=3156259 RepID=UPI003C7D7EA7